MLHIRGGHQTLWLLDGVPVINTAIAANVGPQFDPKDIDYLEVSRGSYGAEYGDRTYGVFNVVPRTGFERNNEGELVVTAGNFYQTDDYLSFGSHTERFAYFASVNGNRSDLGLQTPVPQVTHDAATGIGGFASFIFNADSSNQLRLVTTLRKDYYQIPYDSNPNDLEQTQWPSFGLRDAQREADAGVVFSWVHTFNPKLLMTISPFFHYNSGDYNPLPTDTPVATTEDRSSTYAGAQASITANFARNNLQAGFFSFYQSDNQFFGAIFNDGSGNSPITDTEHPNANLEAFFVDDKFQPFSWMSLSVGMRPTRFATNATGGFTESTVSPRFGATFTVPHLKWTFRAFYGHFYQAPPLETVSGPALIDFANGQGLGFIPLHGEFDEEHQFGVTIPYRGWVLDADNFRTNVTNFLDHNNIGDSSIFFPITVSRAVIRGWELTSCLHAEAKKMGPALIFERLWKEVGMDRSSIAFSVRGSSASMGSGPSSSRSSTGSSLPAPTGPATGGTGITSSRVWTTCPSITSTGQWPFSGARSRTRRIAPSRPGAPRTSSRRTCSVDARISSPPSTSSSSTPPLSTSKEREARSASSVTARTIVPISPR